MLLILAGVFIIAATIADLLLTTVSSRGAGPISASFARITWASFLGAHRQLRSQRLLANGGLTILLGTVLIWAFLLWGGWTLVFLGGEGAIVSSTSKRPADVWAHVYFAGFTLFTLGLGDYKPSGPLWQFLTALCAANGLLTMTLSVTYLLPVLSAVALKRQIASMIMLLGGTPAAILKQSWNGADFKALNEPLTQLYPAITLLAQQHLAYPNLHYFHSTEVGTAFAPRLAALDEAAAFLRGSVRPDARPDPLTLMLFDGAVRQLMETLAPAHIQPANEAPPPFSVVPAGARANCAYTEALEGEPHPDGRAFRRRLHLAFVQNDGWTWADVTG